MNSLIAIATAHTSHANVNATYPTEIQYVLALSTSNSVPVLNSTSAPLRPNSSWHLQLR